MKRASGIGSVRGAAILALMGLLAAIGAWRTRPLLSPFSAAHPRDILVVIESWPRLGISDAGGFVVVVLRDGRMGEWGWHGWGSYARADSMSAEQVQEIESRLKAWETEEMIPFQPFDKYGYLAVSWPTSGGTRVLSVSFYEAMESYDNSGAPAGHRLWQLHKFIGTSCSAEFTLGEDAWELQPPLMEAAHRVRLYRRPVAAR